MAPCDGVVTEVADTGHAMTFRTEDGMEILLLIGIDSFILNGKGLAPLIREGDTVTAGQTIMEAEIDRIRNAGLNPLVITVLSN